MINGSNGSLVIELVDYKKFELYNKNDMEPLITPIEYFNDDEYT